jgi:hypothetical protein
MRRPKKQPAPVAELPRDEWDFENCRSGYERHCFHYEYAREVPWIVDEFRLAEHCLPKVNFGWQPGFDEFGNWHFWSFGNSEMCDDWALVMQVPPGFPDKPYLKTSHRIVEPRRFGISEPPFNEAEEWKKKGVGEMGTWTKVRINWECPDKILQKEFQNWLKRNRPRPPRQQRGLAPARRYRSELKALGAYRLMVKCGMTAEAAQAYTKRFLRYGLYAKIPDWYEAKTRALDNLREIFRYHQESIAAKILRGGLCDQCPGKNSVQNQK